MSDARLRGLCVMLHRACTLCDQRHPDTSEAAGRLMACRALSLGARSGHRHRGAGQPHATLPCVCCASAAAGGAMLTLLTSSLW